MTSFTTAHTRTNVAPALKYAKRKHRPLLGPHYDPPTSTTTTLGSSDSHDLHAKFLRLVRPLSEVGPQGFRPSPAERRSELACYSGNRSGDATCQWFMERELGIHGSGFGPLRLHPGPLDWGSGMVRSMVWRVRSTSLRVRALVLQVRPAGFAVPALVLAVPALALAVPALALAVPALALRVRSYGSGFTGPALRVRSYGSGFTGPIVRVRFYGSDLTGPVLRVRPTAWRSGQLLCGPANCFAVRPTALRSEG
jgi:hypothetical protein